MRVPFPAGSAELVATGHVHWVLKDWDGAETDSTLQGGRSKSVTWFQIFIFIFLFLLIRLLLFDMSFDILIHREEMQ